MGKLLTNLFPTVDDKTIGIKTSVAETRKTIIKLTQVGCPIKKVIENLTKYISHRT